MNSDKSKPQGGVGVLKFFLEQEVTSPTEGEVKTCPCGETFPRPEEASPKSWARMKYCSLHRAMPQHARKKDIERILSEKGSKPDTQTAILEKKVKSGETKTDKLTTERENCAEKSTFGGARVRLHMSDDKTLLNDTKSDSDKKPDSALENITWKRCAYEECGKIFYKPKDMTDGTWATKKFHCDDCRRQAENARARAKTQVRIRERIAQNAVYTPEKAQAVADEKWEDLAQLLSPFVADVRTLDSLRAACTRIGAECYRQCAQDMGVEEV